MQRRTAVALLGAMMLALGACAQAPPRLPPTARSSLLEHPLPDFVRATLDGRRVSTSQLRGHTIVVKFFADYCQPCKRTLPIAEQLHEENPGVAFVGVSEDEDAATARGLVRSMGLSFPVIRDQDNVLAGRFRVRELPFTFVVDRRGIVRWVGGPAQTGRDLARAIAAVE
jgi:thiol-disulfide isomerase/thioredoxin